MSSRKIYGAHGGSVTFDGTDITRARRARLSCRRFPHLQRSRLSLPLSDLRQHHDRQSQAAHQGLWFNLVRRASSREFEDTMRSAHAHRVFEPRLAESDVRAGRRAADDRPAPHRDLPRADQSAKLLLLDEPSAGMTHDETKELMDDILQVRELNRSLTIVIVEHEMGVDRAHHRPLRGAHFGPQDRGRPYVRSPSTARCRKLSGGGVDDRADWENRGRLHRL